MWPFPPLKSPPALPTKTRPSPAIGAAGTDFALFRIRDRRLPKPLAGFEIIGQHPPVLGPTKQHAVEVGGASVGRQNAGGYSSCVRQFSAQVAGLSEKISNSVVPISAFSTMIRPDSKAVYSSTSYVHKTLSLPAFFVLIWLSSEKRSEVSVLL